MSGIQDMLSISAVLASNWPLYPPHPSYQLPLLGASLPSHSGFSFLPFFPLGPSELSCSEALRAKLELASFILGRPLQWCTPVPHYRGSGGSGYQCAHSFIPQSYQTLSMQAHGETFQVIDHVIHLRSHTGFMCVSAVVPLPKTPWMPETQDRTNLIYTMLFPVHTSL